MGMSNGPLSGRVMNWTRPPVWLNRPTVRVGRCLGMVNGVRRYVVTPVLLPGETTPAVVLWAYETDLVSVDRQV